MLSAVTLPAPPSVPHIAGRLRQAPVGRNLPLAGGQQLEMGKGEEGSTVQMELYGPSKCTKLTRPNGWRSNGLPMLSHFGPTKWTVVQWTAYVTSIWTVQMDDGPMDRPCNVNLDRPNGRRSIGPSSIWMVQIDVTYAVHRTVVYLDSPNGRRSNGQSIGPPIYGNLDRQKLRLWTVILDRLKIQLWTVILDCHKIMVVDHNSWWSKISVRDGNFWLSKITVWDMILNRPKLRFGTVILDCPKLRFGTVFWTVKNYGRGMSFWP